MKYRVTIGRDNSLYGLKRDLFSPGEKVEFLVMVATDTNYYVTSEQVKVDCDGPVGFGQVKYSFVMPDCDVTVNIRTENTMVAKGFGMFRKKPRDEKETVSPYGRCPECGYELKDDLKFCPECGTKLK